MKWGEIGLILLATAAIAGFFVVVTSGQQVIQRQDGGTEADAVDDPLAGLEADLAELCYGNGFRDVPSASGDTVVKSMDLIESVPLNQANLHISRTLVEHGFQHVITYSIPGEGLSFLFNSDQGDPFRLELNNSSR